MACDVIHNWTFSALVGAFLDLIIAYLLLCASTIAFFASKFLGFFGLYLPCPCNGFFSNPNRNYCTQQLLLDLPVAQVSSVQFSAKNRFPFDSGSGRDQNLNSGIKLIGDGTNNVDYEREGSISGDTNSCIVVEKKLVVRNQFELKGRKTVTRRRRKIGVDETKSLSAGDLVIPNQLELPLSISCTKEEDNVLVQDDGETSLNELEGDKDNMIILLKQKLEEEHAARAALYQELEEERNAAASAADEAMAMILRLQAEKASIEMEARQYQRMIDEKTAYDLEEMNILKEILLRREKEKHFLEKQVEAYRQMNYEHDDPNEDPSRMLQQISESINNNSVEGWVEYGTRSDEFSNVLKYISDCNQELHEKKMITMEREGQNGQSAVLKEEEEEVTVHDVHVVDVNRNSPSTSTFETDDMSTSTRGVSVISELRTPALDTERVKIENEVGRLRERLRAVQEGREKLNLSVEYKERENLQIQILEDILVQLQQIRQWNNEPEKTTRQLSLPLPPSKISSQKKRCRSASLGLEKSS